jgi:flagellar biosynthesis anti-sigma factor FlgM
MSSDRKEKRGKIPASEAASGIISLEERRRLKKMALAKRGDELRAQKVREIKEQIEEGTYHIDAADVAKSLVRGEVARLLGGKRPAPNKRRES